MPKTNEICKGAKYSNTRTRESQRKREIQKLQHKLSKLHEELSKEKERKNKAYYFILSTNNFNRYTEFSKKFDGFTAWHEACVVKMQMDALESK